MNRTSTGASMYAETNFPTINYYTSDFNGGTVMGTVSKSGVSEKLINVEVFI